MFATLAALLFLQDFNFDRDAAGREPEGFRVRDGTWKVEAADDAPSRPNVLRQTGTAPFPLLMADDPRLKDVGVSVKFFPAGGRVDQAAGLVFRAVDERNYYVVRANALENSVGLYRMRDGRRVLIAESPAEVKRKAWQELAVACAGPLIRCTLDGRLVLSVRDEAFRDAGGVGLWTKADSETSFDDLSIRSLDPTPETLRALPDAGPVLGWSTRLASPVARHLLPEVARLCERLGDYQQAAHRWRELDDAERWDACRLGMAVIDSLEGGLQRYAVTRWTQGIANVEAAISTLLLPKEGDESDEGILFPGVVAERRGDCEEAAKAYGAIAARNPHHVEAQLRLGHVAWRRRDLESAGRHARRAVVLSPASDRPLVLLGRVEAAADRIDAAIEGFDRALELNPGSVASRLGRGTAFIARQIYVQAIREYDRARVVASTGDLDAAERGFRKAVELDPEFARGLSGVGWVMRQRGKHEESAVWYRRATEADPAAADAWAGLGNARSKLHDYGPAVDAYTKALELRPSWSLVRVNRAMAYFSRREFAEAVRDFEAVMAEDPAYADLAREWIRRAREAMDK